MSVNPAIRFDDKRRAKYRGSPMLALSQIAEIQADIANRPDAIFSKGQIVHTAEGYRQITSCHYAGKRWMYRVWTASRFNKMLYRSSDLMSLFFNIGDLLVLPAGVQAIVHTVTIAPNNKPIFTFQIQANQFSMYSYRELLHCNLNHRILDISLQALNLVKTNRQIACN